MIGVAGRDDLDVFVEWVTENGVDGFDHIADADGSVWQEFNVTTQPAFAFINDDGEVETRLGKMGLGSLTDRITQLIEA